VLELPVPLWDISNAFLQPQQKILTTDEVYRNEKQSDGTTLSI
jgi:hypothetical protein